MTQKQKRIYMCWFLLAVILATATGCEVDAKVDSKPAPAAVEALPKTTEFPAHVKMAKMDIQNDWLTGIYIEDTETGTRCYGLSLGSRGGAAISCVPKKSEAER